MLWMKNNAQRDSVTHQKAQSFVAKPSWSCGIQVPCSFHKLPFNTNNLYNQPGRFCVPTHRKRSCGQQEVKGDWTRVSLGILALFQVPPWPPVQSSLNLICQVIPQSTSNTQLCPHSTMWLPATHHHLASPFPHKEDGTVPSSLSRDGYITVPLNFDHILPLFWTNLIFSLPRSLLFLPSRLIIWSPPPRSLPSFSRLSYLFPHHSA